MGAFLVIGYPSQNKAEINDLESTNFVYGNVQNKPNEIAAACV